MLIPRREEKLELFRKNIQTKILTVYLTRRRYFEID